MAAQQVQCAAYVPSTAPVISAGSLNGNVANILANNALTTRITPDLTSTFKYRYFTVNDYSNAVSVDKWLTADTNFPSADSRVRPSSAYTKENASTDLVWRAQRWLTVGVGYGLEGWDRDNRDVAVTTENIGKAFLDLKPWDQAQFRSRFQYSQRRFDQYIPTIESNSVFMREYDLANRDRTQGKFSLDFFPINNVTVTPTGGFRFDHYGTDPYTAHEIGLINDRMSNAGVEVAFNVIPGVKFMTSYMYEDAYRNLVQNTGQYALEVRDKIQTLMLAGEFKIIPDKLIVHATFTHSWSTSANTMSPGPFYTVAGSYAPLATVPDVLNRYNQVDVTSNIYALMPAWRASSV